MTVSKHLTSPRYDAFTSPALKVTDQAQLGGLRLERVRDGLSGRSDDSER